MNVTLGAFTRPWNMLEYEGALDHLSRLFKVGGIMRNKQKLAISLDSTPEQAKAAVAVARARGVEIISFMGTTPNVAKGAEAAAADMRRNVDVAAAAGVPHILCTGAGDHKLSDAYVRALQIAVPYAAEKGVTIGLKPHGGITRTGADCRRFAESAGRKGFGLWFDPGNFVFYDNLNAAEEVKPMAEYCVAVCLKDCARKPDGKPDVNVRPGTGLVDFAACLRALAAAGFSGPMLFECLGGATPDEVDANAGEAKRFIESLLAQL